VTVPATAPVKVVAEVLLSHRVSAVPVIDAHGSVVGMISEADLLVKELALGAEAHMAWFEGSHERDVRRRRDAQTAEQLMTVPVMTVHPDTPLRQAAKTLLEKRIKRLPVVSAGWLVGIVSRADLLRVYLLPDEELRRQAERLIGGTLGPSSAAALRVAVHEGVVAIDGEVTTHSEAELVPRLLSRLEGVVGVESRVTWRYDDLLDAEIRRTAHLQVTPRR
jgi:CBS domain-containing protein